MAEPVSVKLFVCLRNRERDICEMASVSNEKGKAEAVEAAEAPEVAEASEAAGAEAGAGGSGSSEEGCSSGGAVEAAALSTEPTSGDSSVSRPPRGTASKYDFVKVWLPNNLSFSHEIRVQSVRLKCSMRHGFGMAQQPHPTRYF